MATGATIPNMGANVPGALPPPPPMGGNMNNPTGAAGGSTTAAGTPVLPQTVPGAMPQTTPALTPANTTPTGSTSSSSSLGMINSPIPGNTTDDLTDEYGAGIGGYLSSLLSSGGMNTGLLNQVNASEENAMQGSINQGSANLNSTLGAMGVSANSSTTGLANSQYQTQAAANENSQIAQNYMNEYDVGQQTLQGILGGVMQTAGDQPNWMDYLGMGENLATTGIMGAGMIKGL